MARRAKVYRSVLAVRAEGEQDKPRSQPCSHTSKWHGTPEQARVCASHRVRQALAHGYAEVHVQIEFSHSRHMWFPA